MTTTYYKAVRPDGTDFHSGTVQWDVIGSVVRHPTSHKIGTKASTYLSASTVPTDCTGMGWPCRLLTVEPIGPVATPNSDFPHKRAAIAWRVTGELDPYLALGPQGRKVAALIDRYRHLTSDETYRLFKSGTAMNSVAWDAALEAARNRGRIAIGQLVGDIMWDVAWDAALALIVRDIISDEHFQTLTQPWRDAIGDL